MTTPRKRLVKKINPSRSKKGHLSPEERAMIIHAVFSGEGPGTIATRFRVHRNTIQNTIKRWQNTNSLQDRPRNGRPPKLSLREKRALCRRIRQNPNLAYNELVAWVERFCSKKVSCRTIRRALHATGLKHWKSLKRIYLDKKAIRERRQYVRDWRGKENELTQVRLFFCRYILRGTYKY
jgi:transposase